jgi:hypothetical protein
MSESAAATIKTNPYAVANSYHRSDSSWLHPSLGSVVSTAGAFANQAKARFAESTDESYQEV